MSQPHKNESPVSAGQVVKTLYSNATDFIARCASYASADTGYLVLCVVVLVQAVLMAFAGVLQ